MYARLLFQSTLPSQGATLTRDPNVRYSPRFQSTLPSQGATSRLSSSVLSALDFNPRSPHRERPGEYIVKQETEQFQSTLPSQGATICTALSIYRLVFQSTLPSQGATKFALVFCLITLISIHAPLTGSDTGMGMRDFFENLISIHAPLTGSDVG